MQDPLHEYCESCPFFVQQRGCSQMFPPEMAGQQLLDHCPIPPLEMLQRIVRSYLQRKGELAEAPGLAFEVEHAFSRLSAANFQTPQAGARVVTSLLQGLTWRRYAALARQAQGNLQASSCQWFQGVRGTGSFCLRDNPPTTLSVPKACLQKSCFAPFSTVSLEREHEPSATTSRESALEERQIQQQMGQFLALSPILGDLLCEWMEAEGRDHRELKRRWAGQCGVTTRTIENWRLRAASLFFVLYTGALSQLEDNDPIGFQLVTKRDFDPTFPIPSSRQPWKQLLQPFGLSRGEGQRLYIDAWHWMRDWMEDNGYPEARALTLPFQENEYAA